MYENYPIINGWGRFYKVGFNIGHYHNPKNLAIQLVCVEDTEETFCGEPYGTMTVNLGVDCAPDEGFIDVNNTPFLEAFINKYNFGKPTGEMARSGYCIYPLYKFNLAEIEKYLF